MNNSPHSEAVIDLGKKILAQFNKLDGGEILTSWMSHHLASLITRAENERNGPAKELAQQACADGILKLWSHRNSLPRGLRPFQSAEKALQTLIRLSPDASQNFYFRGMSPPKEEESAGSADAKAWLELAELFDKQAREFIRFCLSQSMDVAGPELREWLKLSQGIEQPVKVDIQIVYKLLEDMPDDELVDMVDGGDGGNTGGRKTLSQLDEIIGNLGLIRQALNQKLD